MVAVFGRKTQMTQIYDEAGRVVPVTVIEVKDCVVVRKRTRPVDGYDALQLGYGRANSKHVTKPMSGYYKKAGVGPARHLGEVRMESTEDYQQGQKLEVTLFEPGDKVDVRGSTKGRGFAGGMKRWGWSSGPRTHGSMSHRRVGSIGAGTTPGRILKGRTMAGQYGNERVMVRGLRIVRVDAEKGLMYVSGAVPGNRGGLVLVRKRS
jgi:large subunit ribosomal protein L3